MVGLPVRGKSFLARKGTSHSYQNSCLISANSNSHDIVRCYLKWLSIDAKIFDVDSYSSYEPSQAKIYSFDIKGAEGERRRQKAAEAAVYDMFKWFELGGTIGIYDDTNLTKERRQWIYSRCAAHGINTIFVECKCDDEDFIWSNIFATVYANLNSKGLKPPEVAAREIRTRIHELEKVYQTIDEDESHYTYLKISNIDNQVSINRTEDYLQNRIVCYLTNLHVQHRSIWLARVGHPGFMSLTPYRQKGAKIR